MKKLLGIMLLLSACFLSASPSQQLVQACQQKSATSCYTLALHYDQINQLQKAASLYQKACSLKHAKGCYKLAELYLVGTGVKQSDEKFISYMQRSCKLGYQKSCSFIQKNRPQSPSLQSSSAKNPTNSITLSEKNIGTIHVSANLVDRQKRIVQIDATMRNDYLLASGWLSFSFPDLHTDEVLAIDTQSFDHTRSYPRGYSIYHLRQKKAVKSSYLLVESDAKNWKKGLTKKTHFTLRVPDDIETLTLYIRGTLKHKTQLRAMPLKGIVGQQGFHNAILKIPVGLGNKKETGMQLELHSTSHHPSRPMKIETTLSRREKLILLDKLLSLPYYHRQRKTFEKQLKETLFGGAKYLTFIKSYQCEPKQKAGTYRCLLRLGGKAFQQKREMSWEFQAAFTATRGDNGLKITEMHSLDLLE